MVIINLATKFKYIPYGGICQTVYYALLLYTFLLYNEVMFPEQEKHKRQAYDELNRYHKTQRNTQTFRKFVNYVDNLVANPIFTDEIRFFRGFYWDYEKQKPFPKFGLKLPTNKDEHDKNHSQYDLVVNPNDEHKLDFSDYQKKRFSFEEKYGLDIFGEAFEYILFYNSVEPMFDFGYASFCEVYDLKNLTQMGKGLYSNRAEDRSKELSWAFFDSEIAPTKPVAIFIHPYMSERDVIDYIKKMYKVAILPIQEKYQKKHIKLQGVRTKSKHKKTRNQFIFEHKDKPIKDLVSLIATEYKQIMDYTYVQTIIRTETEKRK